MQGEEIVQICNSKLAYNNMTQRESENLLHLDGTRKPIIFTTYKNLKDTLASHLAWASFL